jgi:hypothetical protein
MKNSALHDWYYLIGIIHACTLSLVLIIILWKKLFFQKSFFALFLNYLVTFFYSLILLDAFPVSDNFKHNFGLINNLVDIPLMLFFLTLFMKGGILFKTITKTILLFVLIEIIILLILGAGKKAETVILGPGILLVLFYSMSAFVPQIKAGINQRRETGKAFMITSVFFAYCCYSVVYLLFYIFQSPQKADVYAVYHLASLLSALLMATGLILEINKPADIDGFATPDKRQSRVKFPDWDESPLKN